MSLVAKGFPNQKSAGLIVLLYLLLFFLVQGIRLYPPSGRLDDALIFYRYSWHILHGHGAVWNPTDGQTYGATSQAFMLLLVPFVASFPNPDIAVMAASGFSGMLLFAAIILYVQQQVRERAARQLCFWLLAAAAPAWYAYSLSGMETALSLAALTAWLAAFQRNDERGWFLGAVGVGAAALYLFRPELAGIAGLALIWRALASIRSMPPRIAVGAYVLALAITLMVLTVCYGSFLPLGALVKLTKVYDEFRYSNFWRQPKYLIMFAYLVAPVAVLLLVARVLSGRQRIFSADAVFFGVLAVGFTLFSFLSVIQIMGAAARFYSPAYILLLPLITDAAKAFTTSATEGRPIVARVVLTASLLASTLPTAIWAVDWIRGADRFSNRYSLDRRQAMIWPGAKELLADPGATVALTEAGYGGTVGIRNYVMDYAGLSTPDIAMRRVAPLAAVERMQPDIIFFPTSDYFGLKRDLLQSSVLRRTHTLFLADRPSAFPVYVRKAYWDYARVANVLANLEKNPETKLPFAKYVVIDAPVR